MDIPRSLRPAHALPKLQESNFHQGRRPGLRERDFQISSPKMLLDRIDTWRA